VGTGPETGAAWPNLEHMTRGGVSVRGMPAIPGLMCLAGPARPNRHVTPRRATATHPIALINPRA
jgi:hypothetical protein